MIHSISLLRLVLSIFLPTLLLNWWQHIHSEPKIFFYFKNFGTRFARKNYDVLFISLCIKIEYVYVANFTDVKKVQGTKGPLKTKGPSCTGAWKTKGEIDPLALNAFLVN